MTESRKCIVILSKGKRKGLPCNRKILQENDDFCKFHLGKSISTDLCKMILTKGERKNQQCLRSVVDDSTICKIHKTLEDKKPYNPYVDKEVDVTITDNEIKSTFGTLDKCELNPEYVY